MCPLWPLHYVFVYSLLLGPLWYLLFGAVGAAADAVTSQMRKNGMNLTLKPELIQMLKVDHTEQVEVYVDWKPVEGTGSSGPSYLTVEVLDDSIVSVNPHTLWVEDTKRIEHGKSVLSFNVTGKFLGYTNICVKPGGGDGGESSNGTEVEVNNQTKEKCMDISVIRQARGVDKIFTYSVALLVSIMYVNMGAALDLSVIKDTIRRPYGPAIGVFSQFVIMPLLSYAIAKAFIRHPALQLGLFITGCSPGGGASNVWTLALGGNLDLSITMTTFSTFAAFAMMPFWIFTLGSTIFSAANLAVPYSKIGTFAISLVVPLAIGIGIQLKWPKVAKLLVRILKPFAIFLIVFIIAFAVYTNLFLFQLFTWQIIICGVLLPWLGYLLGGGLAILLRRDWEDVIAIAVETGVQNTGLSIFALRFSLAQPEADITTVIPVAVAIMTPVIPSFVLLMQRLHARVVRSSGFALTDKEDSMVPSLAPSI